MTDTHRPAGHDVAPRVWPRDPGQFVDTALCPACFAPLASPVCAVCGLDLRSPRAGALLDAGTSILEAETRRQSLIAQMRREQAELAAQAQATGLATQTQPAQSAIVPPTAPVAASAPAAPVPAPVPQAAPASKRSGVQIFLLSLGIVLVAVAAIFFVLIAYVFASLEVRSVMTGVAGVIVLAIAWFLRSRRLPATAEGVAIVAVVIGLLDIWIVRANDVFGSGSVDVALYTGISLVVLGAVLLGVRMLTHLRVSGIAAAALVPFGVLFITFGALGDATVASAWWAALTVVGAVTLSAAVVRARLEGTVVRSIGYAATALAMPFAAAALEDAPWTRSLTFAAVSAIWVLHAILVARISGVGKLRSAWITAAGVAAGFSGVLAVVVPVLLAGDLQLRYWLPASGAFTLALIVVTCVQRTRTGSALRHVLIVALVPIGIVAGLAIVPVIAALVAASSSSTMLTALRFWERGIGASADVPLAEVTGAAVVGVSVCAALTTLGLLVTARLRRLISIPTAAGALALCGLATLAGSIGAVAASFAAITVAATLIALVWPARLDSATRTVVGVTGVSTTVGMSLVGFGSGVLWPFTSALALAVLVIARSYAVRLAGHRSAVVVGPVLTALTALGCAIVIASLPGWLYGPWQQISPTAGPLDVAFWLATAAAIALAILGVIRLRPLTDADVHVIAIVASLAICVSIPAIAGGVAGGADVTAARITVAGLVAGTAILWQLPRTRVGWIEGAILSAIGPLALVVWAAAIASASTAQEAMAAAVVPGGLVVAAAISIALFSTRSRSLPSQLWQWATVIAGIAVTGWVVVSGGALQWLSLALIALTALLVAACNGNPVTSMDPRRHFAWAALPLGVASLWSFLSAQDVAVVEPYTLPIAGALALIGAVVTLARVQHEPSGFGRNALVGAAGIVAFVPSVFASAFDVPDGNVLRPVMLIVAGVVLAVGSLIVPSVVRGLRIRLILASTGIAASVAVGFIQAMMIVQERGIAGIELEAWIAPGIAAAIVVATRWTRRGEWPGWMIPALSATVIAAFAFAESSAIAHDEHATPRILVSLGVLGAAHIAAVVWHDRGAVHAAEWLSLAGMLVVGAVALLAQTANPFELVTVPIGVALAAAGIVRLDRTATARSWAQLGPACALLVGPPLVADFTESPLWRVVGLGVFAVTMVIVAVVLRWQAPLIIGGSTVLVHAVAQLWPWISSAYTAVPWWLWLGVGGIILIVLAATYEKRLRNLRSVIGSISALR